MVVNSGKNKKSLVWKKRDLSKIPSTKWYEEGRTLIDDKLVFKFYEQNELIYLVDINTDITYKLPKDKKAKGYILAFKLFSI